MSLFAELDCLVGSAGLIVSFFGFWEVLGLVVWRSLPLKKESNKGRGWQWGEKDDLVNFSLGVVRKIMISCTPGILDPCNFSWVIILEAEKRIVVLSQE
jgi:hypothetical protein